MTTNLVASHKNSLSSLSSGSQESKIKVGQARLPLEAPGEGPDHLVQLPGLLVVPGWKVNASLQSLPPSSCGLSLGVCSLPIRTPSLHQLPTYSCVTPS